MTKKEVSMSELFFDLVFVYVLSTINHTVEHISSNLVSLESLGKTFMLFLVFFAIWTYRTFLVNRFFKKKWYQYIFVFTDMFLILLLSKSINSNFQETFTPFVVITAIIFMSILLQYIINYTLHREAGTLKLVLTYTAGLFTAIIFSIISIFLSPNINFWIYFTGILILAFLPGILYKTSKEKPVYFTHLTERLSLFIILLFGEGIVGMINTVESLNLNINDILSFMVIISLFIIYTLHYKYSLTEELQNSTGFKTAYLHLFIIYSLDFIFMIMNKSLSSEELLTTEIVGYVIAFLVFLLAILLDTQFYKSNENIVLMTAIVLINSLICLFLTEIMYIIILELLIISYICYLYIRPISKKYKT